MKIYYAHALCLYGREEEREEIRRIRDFFPGTVIVNPSSHENRQEKQRRYMEYCKELVEKSDSVVFSRLLGKITAGVAKEINYALSLGRPVFELKDGKIHRVRKRVRGIPREETRALYVEWELKRMGGRASPTTPPRKRAREARFKVVRVIRVSTLPKRDSRRDG